MGYRNPLKTTMMYPLTSMALRRYHITHAFNAMAQTLQCNQNELHLHPHLMLDRNCQSQGFRPIDGAGVDASIASQHAGSLAVYRHSQLQSVRRLNGTSGRRPMLEGGGRDIKSGDETPVRYSIALWWWRIWRNTPRYRYIRTGVGALYIRNKLQSRSILIWYQG